MTKRSKKKIGLNDIKEFYKPHPGFVGARFGIPMDVKKTADRLNGQSISIHEALKQISAAGKNRAAKIGEEENCITLEVDCNDPEGYDVTHTFSIIRFR